MHKEIDQKKNQSGLNSGSKSFLPRFLGFVLWVRRNIVPALLVALGGTLLSAQPAIAITLTLLGSLDYSHQLAEQMFKDRKKEGKCKIKRSWYRSVALVLCVILHGAYLLTSMIVTPHTQLAALYISGITPFFMLLARILHGCIFAQTDKEKVVQFSSQMSDNELDYWVIETDTETFHYGKYLSLRFFHPELEKSFEEVKESFSSCNTSALVEYRVRSKERQEHQERLLSIQKKIAENAQNLFSQKPQYSELSSASEERSRLLIVQAAPHALSPPEAVAANASTDSKSTVRIKAN